MASRGKKRSRTAKTPHSSDSTTDRDKLYRIRIVEEDGDRFKVHYIGYSRKEDEWKTRDELIVLPQDAGDGDQDEATTATSEDVTCTVWQPFSLYRELGNRIKCSLQSSRKDSPMVKIDLPFDKLLFDGGLAKVGTKKRVYYKQQRYSIKSYKDLDPLLGSGWHWRGLNEAGDFCFVILTTLEYYIKHKKPLKEFFPPTSKVHSATRDLGYTLVLTFVRGDGTPSQFGTSKDIFL